MKLTYHTGQNFGDALNPLIFEYFLGKDFFDNDDSVQFLGIGSILGLKKNPGYKIVFSSGYAAGDESAYGSPPEVDNTYDIVCVRGKETAKILNIPFDKAVTDGAILISELPYPEVEKKHEVSFVPHHISLKFYSGWKEICNKAGIHLIDPRKDLDSVIDEIRSSKVVLAEAMHGAIVSDSFRIPWVPVVLYPHINRFKWSDWCSSLDMKYHPFVNKDYLHDVEFLLKVLKNKYPYVPSFVALPVIKVLLSYRKNRLIKFLKNVSSENHLLSQDDVFVSKKKKLLELINYVKIKYHSNN